MKPVLRALPPPGCLFTPSHLPPDSQQGVRQSLCFSGIFLWGFGCFSASLAPQSPQYRGDTQFMQRHLQGDVVSSPALPCPACPAQEGQCHLPGSHPAQALLTCSLCASQALRRARAVCCVPRASPGNSQPPSCSAWAL